VAQHPSHGEPALWRGGGQLEEWVEGAEEAGALIQAARGRDFARSRRSIIAANAELQERELIKLASWADTLAGALSARGVDDRVATLAAETGIVVFHVAFDRWVGDGDERDLPELIRESLGELKALTAERRQPATSSDETPSRLSTFGS
jgi:hypothetical protein